MASYPGTLRQFLTKVNTTEVVYAEHMNDVQDEVMALQAAVGTNPRVSSAGTGSSLGAWSSSARTYATLSDRIANVEAGHTADTHTQYVRFANTETISGTKTFSAQDTYFGAATGAATGRVHLSSGTTGGEATLQWRDGTTPRWAFYRTSATAPFYLRDMVNARQHATFTPGVSDTAATTAFHSTVNVGGNATVTGTLGVTGATTVGALTMSGALTLAAGTGVTPSTSSVGQAAAGGTSTTVARADHIHGREAFGTTATAVAFNGATSAGAATTPSRSDHVHSLPAGAVVAQTGWGGAVSSGVATSVSRADHTHGTPAAPTAASVGALATTGGTLTGGLKITGGGIAGANAGTHLQLAGASPQLEFFDTDQAVGAPSRAWFHFNSGTFYLLRDTNGDTAWDTPHPLTVSMATGNVVAGTQLFEAGNRVYSAANPPPIAAPVVIMPFFIGGSIGVGLRRPEFLATVPMTLRGARSRSHVGSGTYQVYVNGASASGAAAAFGTVQALHDFADVLLNAGDRVQINIASATVDAADLSVTLDVVTR